MNVVPKLRTIFGFAFGGVMYKLLLVSDKEEIRSLYRRYAEWNTLGFEQPDVAENAQQGIDLLSHRRYDAISSLLSVSEGKKFFAYLSRRPEMLGMETARDEAHLRREAKRLAAFHFARRPAENPVAAFAGVFPKQVEAVADRPFGFFHKYAFNTLRQLGANFELAGSHLDWLGPDNKDAADAARKISETAKSVQFQIARAVTRRKFDPLATALDPAIEAWDTLMSSLAARID